MNAKSWVAAAALSLAVGGCAQAGGLGEILGGVLGQGAPAGGQGGNVVAEVQSVDTRNQVIQIRTDQGQNVNVRFDNNTRVSYQQQNYPVTSLEYGDVVRMNVTQTNQNEYYTQLIEVQQSVQERSGNTGGGSSSGGSTDTRLYQVQGSVDQVDYSRGLFTVRTQNGSVLTVAMPYNPRVSEKDRFERLRRGDTVRVEGRYTSQTRMELERFF